MFCFSFPNVWKMTSYKILLITKVTCLLIGYWGLEKLLKKHIELEHEGKRFKCNICEQGFRRKLTLKEHKASKHEGGASLIFKCNICDHETKSSSNVLSSYK